MAVVLLFLIYSAFCYWVVFLDGADVLEGWKSFFLLGWFAAALTPDELRFYVGLSWLVGFVLALIRYFSAASP